MPTKVTRDVGLGTYITFKSDVTPFTVTIELTNTPGLPIEILWTSPDGLSGRLFHQAYDLRSSHLVGSIPATKHFVKVLLEAIEMAEGIEAGTFDIESIPIIESEPLPADFLEKIEAEPPHFEWHNKNVSAMDRPSSLADSSSQS